MKKVYFKCTFKADIVLNSKTSTEGKNSPLDYISGNVFLGIVAKKYKDYIKKDAAFDVFHSGKVRFNDATLLINGKESYKTPFSYFAPKGEDDKVYVHHKIGDDLFKELREKGIQLKQKRSGYINRDGNYLNIKSTYSQKSAYDKKTRKSKDSQMFGYNAIKRGTEFLFSIDFDENIAEDLQEQIISDLKGNKFIGKSKTAQYGKVKIEKIEEGHRSNATMVTDFAMQHRLDNEEIVIYAKSNLAFIDKETGMPTAQPVFKNATIIWEKSQIRTRRYTPYNGVRKTFDYERMIIEKGSVFIIKLDEGYDFNDFKKVIENGVGIYKNEGFGQVLINPIFLIDLNPKFKPDEKFKDNKEIDGFDGLEDTELVNWLNKKKQKSVSKLNFIEEINKFINISKNWNKLNEPSLSQWGQMRSICSSSNNNIIYDKLFNDSTDLPNHEKGFCVHGKSKEQWKDTLSLLKKYDNNAKFLELLSIEVMRKIKANSKKEDK